MSAREVVRGYLAAMERGDREAAVALYAEDVVMYVPGRSAFAGERRGREAVLAYLRAAVELADWGGSGSSSWTCWRPRVIESRCC
jgi:ketosteroid isomerase-like protein